MSADLSPELFQMDALLRRASSELAYPPTPRIAEAVAARLREEPARQPLFGRLFAVPFARAAAGAMLVLAVLAVSLVVPQTREGLADLFGLNNVRVDKEPSAGPTPPPLSPESFAQPSTVAEAQAAVDFPLRFPVGQGGELEPDDVYLVDVSSPEPVVIFTYEDEAFDLYQTRSGIFGKGGPDPSLIHEIEFDGQPALWIDEGGHIAQFFDAQGRLVVESVRSIDRATLLWERDGVTYRLETSLSQAEAIEVVRSLS